MNKYLFLLAPLVAGSACTLPPPEFGYPDFQSVPAATCHSAFAATYDASGFTDAGEQTQLTNAGNAWRDLSKGQINFTIRFDPLPGAGNQHLFRVHSTDQVVIDYEATQKMLEPGAHIAGWHDSNDDIYLVVDREPVGSQGQFAATALQSLATHELGHGAHLRWPLCVLSNTQCVHSPDPSAVMAAILEPGVLEMTPSDLALCRASCLCP